MHSRSAGFNQCSSQLIGIEVATKPGLCVRHNGCKPMCCSICLSFGMLDLVCSLEGIVNSSYDGWHTIDRVQTLIGVHLACRIGISSDLPAAEVDSLKAGLNLLNGLVARHS